MGKTYKNEILLNSKFFENSKIQNVKESIEDSNNSIEDEYIKLFSNIF